MITSANLLLITAISLDICSTNKGLRNYDQVVEKNPIIVKLFGNKPSASDLILYESQFILSSILLSYISEKSKFKVCKMWIVPSLALTFNHFDAAYKNFQLLNHIK
jgi:hypothetical protein